MEVSPSITKLDNSAAALGILPILNLIFFHFPSLFHLSHQEILDYYHQVRIIWEYFKQ